MVPNYHCILHIAYYHIFQRSSRSPIGKGSFLKGKGQTVVKYNPNGTSIASSVFARAKTDEAIDRGAVWVVDSSLPKNAQVQ